MLELNSTEVDSVGGGGTAFWVAAGTDDPRGGANGTVLYDDNFVYHCSSRQTFESGRFVTQGSVCIALRPQTEEEIQWTNLLRSIQQN